MRCIQEVQIKVLQPTSTQARLPIIEVGGVAVASKEDFL